MYQTSDLYTATSGRATVRPRVEVILLPSTQGCRIHHKRATATGEGSGLTAAVAEVWDSSDFPTYRWYGSVREIPGNGLSSLYQGLPWQAEVAASERLRRNLGTGGKLSWTQVVNHA